MKGIRSLTITIEQRRSDGALMVSTEGNGSGRNWERRSIGRTRNLEKALGYLDVAVNAGPDDMLADWHDR
jgi:hypothetical protein